MEVVHQLGHKRPQRHHLCHKRAEVRDVADREQELCFMLLLPIHTSRLFHRAVVDEGAYALAQQRVIAGFQNVGVPDVVNLPWHGNGTAPNLCTQQEKLQTFIESQPKWNRRQARSLRFEMLRDLIVHQKVAQELRMGRRRPKAAEVHGTALNPSTGPLLTTLAVNNRLTRMKHLQLAQ
jgi:hypothetical protein